MAIFVKQNGQWRKIDSPYVKKDGQWILPEEAYIKENGEWKLIFDRFAFVVETIGRTETQEAAVLEGRLSNFGNTPNAINEAGHFRTTLTESLAAPAVAISQEAGRIAVGGIDDSVYVYNLNFNFIGELIEPTNDISSLDIDDATGEIAASDLGGSTYVYDSDFNLIIQIGYPSGNPLSVSYNQGSGTAGTLAIGGEDDVFIYDDTYTQIDNVSFPATVRSVDWRQSDGYLAVGGDDPNVRIFDNSFSLDQTVNTNHQGTTKVAFGSANGQLGVLDEQKIHVYSNNFTRQDTLTQGGGGPIGDIAWDGSGRIAHGSQDNFVYVYDQNASLVNVFDEGQRDYRSIDWGPEQLLVAGTLQQQDGEAYVYSTAVSGFFEWGIDGTGTPNRVRSGPLQSEGVTYSFDLDGLNPNTVHDFRAGAEAEEGRTAFGDMLSFETPELSVQTNPIQSGDIDSTSADVSGEVTNFNRPTRLPAVSIEWGETPPQGNGFSNEVDLGSSDSTFSAALTGLDTDTQYQYRAKAKFGGVTQRGITEIFTTDDLIINLDTLAAQNVSQTSADFQGEITDIIGASSADTFFEFREVGASNFNRLPLSGFETVNDSNLPATVDLELSGLTSDQKYEYRFMTDSGFDGGIKTFTTPAFSISIDSASWDLRGSAFAGGESLTFGDSASVDATISEFDGQSYNYEVRESISGSLQGTVASGTNNTSNLNLNWNVGDSFTEGDATDSDAIEYELFVDITIDGASSNDNATVSGNYVESPKIGVQQTVTINVQEGSFTDRDIDVSETSQLDTLSLNNISVDNDSGGNFSLQSASSETVSADTTEQITVRYFPPVGSSGTDTADLTFDHNAKNESSPLTVDLTGQVNVSTTAALASGQSGSIGFSDTFITNDSNTQTISITEDSGSGSYSINNVTLSGTDSGDFNIVQNTVPGSVDDTGASFDVEFVPSSRGNKNATVEINHDADNPSGNLTVDVSGTAVEETTISVEDESISVVEGNSDTVQVTIEETAGDFGATINSVTKSSAPDLGLWQVSSVPNSVGAGSTATFDVQFSPQDENDDQTLTLDIQFEGTDAGGTFTNTTQSTVNGTAVLQVNVEIDVTPNSLDFGTASSPETQSYTVTNTGNVDVDISTTSPSSPFSITNGPGSGISPGNDTTITVEYDPSTTSSANDSITVTGDGTFDPGSDSETVNMSGDGIPANPSISVSPSSFDYGEGAGSNTFDVTNNGNTSLSNVSVNITGTDSGDFSKDSTLGTTSLSVGQTEQVTIGYNPTNTSTDDASLDASGDGSGQTATDSASLSGDGLVAGFVQSITAPSNDAVEKNSTITATGGSITFGGETSVSYNVSASGSNVSASSSASGTVDPNTTSSVNFSVDVTGNTESTNNTITVEETNSNQSDTFDVTVFTDPAPSIADFTFNVIAGNSTNQTNTAINNGTGTNSDLTLSNVSLNAGASSELSVSNTGRDVTVTADASSASGGETYTGTVTVVDDGANSSLETQDQTTANVSVSVEQSIDLSVDSPLSMSGSNAGTDATGSVTIRNDGASTATFTPSSVSITQNSGSVGSPNITADGDGDIPGGGGTETYTVTVPTNSGASDQTTVGVEVNDPEISATSDTFNINNYDLAISSGLSLLDSNIDSSTSGTITLANNGALDYDLSDLSTSASTGDVLASASVDNAGTGTISSGSSKDFNVSSSPNEPDAGDGDPIFVSVSLSDNGPLSDSQNASANYDVVAPVLSLGTNTLSFSGNQKAGTSISDSFTVENTGGMDSTVNTSTSSGIGVNNASISPVSGSSTVPAGGSTEFTVSADIDSSAPDQTQSSIGGTVTSTEDSDQSVSDSAQLGLVSPNLNVTADPSFPSTIYRGESGFSSAATIENNGGGTASVSASFDSDIAILDNESLSPSSTTISSGQSQDFTYSFDTSGSGADLTFDIEITVTEDNTGQTVISTSNEFTLTDPPSFSFIPTSYTIDEVNNTGTVNFAATGTINQGESYSVSLNSGASGTLSASDVDSGSASIDDFNTTGGSTVTITLTRDFDGASDSGSVQALSEGGGFDGGDDIGDGSSDGIGDTDGGGDSGDGTGDGGGGDINEIIDSSSINIEPGTEPLDDGEQDSNDGEESNNDNQNQ